jgi:fluoride ion exporter CrcB/FEX
VTCSPIGELLSDLPSEAIVANAVLFLNGLWLLGRIADREIAVLDTGILGGFTTFSSFSLDVAVLYTRGEWMLCAIYLWASLVLSIGAFFFGLGLVRHMVTPAV